MRFMEIIPPEAGKLDEHKAVVELTAGDLEWLREAVGLRLAPGRPWASELFRELADVQQRLHARIEQAAAPAEEG